MDVCSEKMGAPFAFAAKMTSKCGNRTMHRAERQSSVLEVRTLDQGSLQQAATLAQGAAARRLMMALTGV
jgi:hypothetical protein